MSATEELRRLLDERGIEWYDGDAATYWADADALESVFSDNTLDISLYGITPAKAIEATMGRGKCTMDHKDGSETWWWSCNECGADVYLPSEPRYCPSCGREVVKG